MKKNTGPNVRKGSGAKTMRRNEPEKDMCALYAPNIERNYYDDYVEGVLLPAEETDFEEHLKNCPICMREVAASKRLGETVSQSPRLSEFGLKRSAARRMKYADQILSRQSILDDDLAIALAAAPPRRLDVSGVAYGVAVNKETGQGALLECIALIGDLSIAESELEIIAKEVITRTKDGVEVKVTPPTDYLERLLKAMFKRHPLLKPFKLYKKAICVEVNYKAGSGYIYKSDSVALAVLVAILSAVTGKPVDKDLLFSAGIKLNGYLEGVGDLEHKIQIAKQQCMKACYTADETRPISAKQTIEKSGIALHYFDKLEDVLERLELIGQSTAGKQKSSQTRSKKR